MTEFREPRDIDPHRYAGVRTVVLGATGFIGRWVARRLCAAGANVSLPVRDKVAARDIFDAYDVAGEVYELDFRDASGVRALLQRIRPAITFNLAGYGIDRTERDDEWAYRLNAHLIEDVCAALATRGEPGWAGQAVVHAGTAMEYGSVGGDLAETSLPEPTTLYGQSKLAGTKALTRCCRIYNLNGLTARLFAVYGPGESPDRLLPTLVNAAHTQNAIPLSAGLHERDFVYVEDVAEGLLRLGLTSVHTGEAVNVATGVLSSIRTFAQTAAGVLGVPAHRLEFGALPTRPEEMSHGRVTVERLRVLTGWTPQTSIVDGVRNTLSFEQTATPRAAHHGC